MKKFIISIHSFVDIITNSSTELFVLDTSNSVEFIEKLLKEKEKEFPPEYGHYISVDALEDWRIGEMFGYIDEENAINILRIKGYEIKKTNIKSTYIQICSERGGMHPKLKQFIENTFNVIYYTTEA
jgi:hypothetical protein